MTYNEYIYLIQSMTGMKKGEVIEFVKSHTLSVEVVYEFVRTFCHLPNSGEISLINSFGMEFIKRVIREQHSVLIQNSFDEIKEVLRKT